MTIDITSTDPTASVVDTRALPIIDLSGLASGEPMARMVIVERLRDACLDNGFFYLVNHGVSAVLMNAVIDQGRRLFALSAGEKEAITATHSSGRGYGRMGGRVLSGELGAAVKEEFYCARERALGSHDQNQWPLSLPDFRETMTAYIEDMHALAEQMMGLLAEGMGLPGDHFVDLCQDPIASLRIARYPPEGAEAGAHCDFGALTFLLQDDAGGLQVFDRVTGGWIHAEPVFGSFIVNLGQLFEVLTNKIYPSTLHRVVHPAGKERISAPFFYTGAANYVVSCLPQFQRPGEAALLPPITPSGNLVAGHEAQGF